MLEFFLKGRKRQEEREWMRDEMVTYSKCPRQWMRTTWTLPLQFFMKEYILTKKKKIAVIAWAHTWDKGGEIGWLLEMQYLKNDKSNLEIYSMSNRKPMKISKSRRNVAKARFLSNDTRECILNKL